MRVARPRDTTPSADSGRTEAAARPAHAFYNSGGKCNSVMGTGSNVTAAPGAKLLPLPQALGISLALLRCRPSGIYVTPRTDARPHAHLTHGSFLVARKHHLWLPLLT